MTLPAAPGGPAVTVPPVPPVTVPPSSLPGPPPVPAPAGSPWLRGYRALPDPTVRLVCLPHAGGSASFFRDWRDGLPPGAALDVVCYPGREDRLGAPPATSLIALADAVAVALTAGTDVPVVLFGHSMGAVVAYEVARRLEDRAPGAVRHLVVSGAEAPHVARHLPVDEWPDDEVVAELHRSGGGGLGPYLAAFDDEDLRPLLLDALREDYRLLRRYRPARDVPPLRTPVTAVAGTGDPGCRADAVRRWRDLTSSRWRLRFLDGDHFYLVPRRDAVLALVGEALVGEGPP